MVVRDIVKKARMTLGDMNSISQRWSDERLIDLVDEGHKDIAKRALLYHDITYVPLEQGVYEYRTSPKTIKVERVSLMDERRLPFTTYAVMDDYSENWREETGCVLEAIIKSRRDFDKLSVYPIPDCIEYKIPLDNPSCIKSITCEDGVFKVDAFDPSIVYPVGQIVVMSYEEIPEDQIPAPWGIIVGTGTIDENDTLTYEYKEGVQMFGSLIWTDETFFYLNDIWGATTSVLSPDHVLKIRSVSEPEDIYDLDAPLFISDIWATALKYYVAGYALQDDNDDGNIARGERFIARYASELDKAFKLSSEDTHSDRGARGTQFNPGGLLHGNRTKSRFD